MWYWLPEELLEIGCTESRWILVAQRARIRLLKQHQLISGKRAARRGDFSGRVGTELTKSDNYWMSLEISKGRLLAISWRHFVISIELSFCTHSQRHGSYNLVSINEMCVSALWRLVRVIGCGTVLFVGGTSTYKREKWRRECSYVTLHKIPLYRKVFKRIHPLSEMSEHHFFDAHVKNSPNEAANRQSLLFWAETCRIWTCGVEGRDWLATATPFNAGLS